MLDKDVTVNRSKQAEGVELFALLAGLICLVVLSRVIFISTPYYVDGPNHVAAVTSGDLFLQRPGYFLFNFVARTIYLTGLIGAASNVTLLNIGLSAFGSAIFCVLSIRLMPGMVGLLLAVFYSFSDTVWFVSDIHSTYAAMTFFCSSNPLLHIRKGKMVAGGSFMGADVRYETV